jgi:hypothetical protein
MKKNHHIRRTTETTRSVIGELKLEFKKLNDLHAEQSNDNS